MNQTLSEEASLDSLILKANQILSSLCSQAAREIPQEITSPHRDAYCLFQREEAFHSSSSSLIPFLNQYAGLGDRRNSLENKENNVFLANEASKAPENQKKTKLESMKQDRFRLIQPFSIAKSKGILSEKSIFPRRFISFGITLKKVTGSIRRQELTQEFAIRPNSSSLPFWVEQVSLKTNGEKHSALLDEIQEEMPICARRLGSRETKEISFSKFHLKSGNWRKIIKKKKNEKKKEKLHKGTLENQVKQQLSLWVSTMIMKGETLPKINRLQKEALRLGGGDSETFKPTRKWCQVFLEKYIGKNMKASNETSKPNAGLILEPEAFLN